MLENKYAISDLGNLVKVKNITVFETVQTTGQEDDLWSVVIWYALVKISPISLGKKMPLRPERLLGGLHYIEKDMGFVLGAICEDFLRFAV